MMREGERRPSSASTADQHFTQPPPRFSEASLVKRLEELGIGRPSTYASIVQALEDRAYVRTEKNRFFAEDKGRLLTAFLERFFQRYVDYDFTAEMEDELDEVSAGGRSGRRCSRVLEGLLEGARRDRGAADHRGARHAQRGARAAPLPEDAGLRAAALQDLRDRAAQPEDPATARPSSAARTIPSAATPARSAGGDEGDAALDGKVLGVGAPAGEVFDEDAGGQPVTLHKGPYGYYVQLGEPVEGQKPPRASIPKGMEPGTLTLERALDLLSLPRTIGRHPEDGVPVEAGIGRYGPFVKHGSIYANIADAEEVFTIGMNRAMEVLAQKAQRAGAGRGAAVAPLRELGSHPDGGTVAVYAGRYGPYVKWEKVNATLPKEMAPEAVTLAQALELIAARPAGKKRPAPRRRRRPSPRRPRPPTRATGIPGRRARLPRSSCWSRPWPAWPRRSWRAQ